MNLGLDFRRGLNSIPGALETLAARINVLWKKQHDPQTGAHTNVVATSLSAPIVVLSPHPSATPPKPTWFLGSAPNGSLVITPAAGDVTRGTQTGSMRLVFTTPLFTAEQRIRIESGSTTIADFVSNGDFEVFDDIVSIGGDFFGLAQSAGRFFERGRVTAMGDWIAVAFNAGNFTANGAMTWTVASGDVLANRYTLVGKTLTWTLQVSTTTVGGTLNTELRATIPGGFTIAGQAFTKPAVVTDNGTLTDSVRVQANGGNTFVQIVFNNGANWTASTDNTAVWFTITLEIA